MVVLILGYALTWTSNKIIPSFYSFLEAYLQSLKGMNLNFAYNWVAVCLPPKHPSIFGDFGVVWIVAPPMVAKHMALQETQSLFHYSRLRVWFLWIDKYFKDSFVILWRFFGDYFGILWGFFGDSLGIIWGLFGEFFLRIFWGFFRDSFENFLGILSGFFRDSFVIFCDSFVILLWFFWNSFGIFLGFFRILFGWIL